MKPVSTKIGITAFKVSNGLFLKYKLKSSVVLNVGGETIGGNARMSNIFYSTQDATTDEFVLLIFRMRPWMNLEKDKIYA